MAVQIVGISDLKVALPPDTLVTYALGSCVGICLLDSVSMVGGLSHIMLPYCDALPNDKNKYKFADSAIPELIRQMELKGARTARMTAKIAGGAQMFELQQGVSNEIWQVGRRNVTAVLETLQKLKVPVVSKDVLENYGRTVSFNPQNGVMTVRAVKKEPISI